MCTQPRSANPGTRHPLSWASMFTRSGIACLYLSNVQALAIDNMGLFLHCFSRGHETLKVEVLHILSDIFMVHGMGFLSEETVKPESIISTWTKALKSEDEPEVAAAAAESLAKLMLASVVTEDEVLKVLVETYFDPSSAENNPLKQALSYFFPVYCHSVPENQYRMANVQASVTPLTLGCGLGNSFDVAYCRGFGGR